MHETTVTLDLLFKVLTPVLVLLLGFVLYKLFDMQSVLAVVNSKVQQIDSISQRVDALLSVKVQHGQEIQQVRDEQLSCRTSCATKIDHACEMLRASVHRDMEKVQDAVMDIRKRIDRVESRFNGSTSKGGR